jgi:hypothetical protein
VNTSRRALATVMAKEAKDPEAKTNQNDKPNTRREYEMRGRKVIQKKKRREK